MQVKKNVLQDEAGRINLRLIVLVSIVLSGVVIAVLYFPPLPISAKEGTSGDIAFVDSAGNALIGAIEISGAGTLGGYNENVNFISWDNVPNASIYFNAFDARNLSVNLRIAGDSPQSKVMIENYGIDKPVGVNVSVPGIPVKYVEVNATSVPFAEAELYIQYTDTELGGQDEGTLAVYFYDGMNLTWSELPASLDAANNTLGTAVNSFSVFAISAIDARIPDKIEIHDARKIPVLSDIKTYDEARALKKAAKTTALLTGDIPDWGEFEVDALATKNVAVKLKLNKVTRGEVILDDFGKRNPVSVPLQGSVVKYVEIGARSVSYSSAEITIRYDESELNGGNENDLTIYHWNGAAWEALPTTVDLTNKTLTATTTSLSPFGVATDVTYYLENNATSQSIGADGNTDYNTSNTVIGTIPYKNLLKNGATGVQENISYPVNAGQTYEVFRFYLPFNYSVDTRISANAAYKITWATSASTTDTVNVSLIVYNPSNGAKTVVGSAQNTTTGGGTATAYTNTINNPQYTAPAGSRLVVQINATATADGTSGLYFNDAASSYINIAETAIGVTPYITTWHNNKTNDKSTSIGINTSEAVMFSATANQTITVWNWYKDNTLQSSTFDNFTTSWDTPGSYRIDLNATNDNGTSNTVTWFVTVQTLSVAYIPSSPVNMNPTTGNFWINHTWQAGPGNVTDSYNVSVNGIWYNGTADTFRNTATTPHGWANITVQAYNSSGAGSLSSGSISQDIQVQNNPPVQAAIGNKNTTAGSLLTFTVSASDLDNDTIAYGTNATKGTLDPATGDYLWQTSASDAGTYTWHFNSSDNYGGAASEIITITVNLQTYNLSGYVTNKFNDIPLSGAAIQTNTGLTTATNATGFYGFTGLLNGTYVISASLEGYIPGSITAIISSANVINANISLLPLLGAPNITSWGNNKTNNLSTSISINKSEPVRFNATANQTITMWNWLKDDISQNNDFDNFTTIWTVPGTYNVSVNATSTKGASSTVTWNIDVAGNLIVQGSLIDTVEKPLNASIRTTSPDDTLINSTSGNSFNQEVPENGFIQFDANGTKKVSVKFKMIGDSRGSRVILDDYGWNNPVASAPPGKAIKYVNISAINVSFDIARISIYYTNTELGSEDENTLVIYHWNNAAWEPLLTEIDEMNNTLTATTTSLSPFAVSAIGGMQTLRVTTNRYTVFAPYNTPTQIGYDEDNSSFTFAAGALVIDANGYPLASTNINYYIYSGGGALKKSGTVATNRNGIAFFSYNTFREFTTSTDTDFGLWTVKAERADNISINGIARVNINPLGRGGCSKDVCHHSPDEVNADSKVPLTSSPRSPYSDNFGMNSTKSMAYAAHVYKAATHGVSNPSSCNNCHTGTDRDPAGTSINSPWGVHKNMSCTDCHKNPTTWPITIPDCYSSGCHPRSNNNLTSTSTLATIEGVVNASIYSTTNGSTVVPYSVHNGSQYGNTTGVPCWICHGPMHNITKPDPFPANTNNITEYTQCLFCHNAYQRHNSSVSCTVCHSQDIHAIKVFAQNATYVKGKTNAARGNCTSCHQNSSFMSALLAQSRAGSYSGKIPQIQKPLNHSNDPGAGMKWNSTQGYWNPDSTITACKYCHGNTLHNNTALGRPSLFKGNNTVNSTVSVYSSWCASCHWQGYVSGAGNYTDTVNTYNFPAEQLLVPPEITGNLTYGANQSKPDYYDHSNLSMDDASCKSCHGSLTRSTTITGFLHNVGVGTLGGADCIACHDAGGSAGAGKLVNFSAMNDSSAIHRDLNSGVATSLSNENKKCWACHGSGSEPNGHPSNYRTPYRCEDCHIPGPGQNLNFTPRSILNVTQHYRNGSNVSTSNVTSCYACHNRTEMMVGLDLDPDGTGSVYGGENGGSSSTSHYGRIRDDMAGMDATTYCNYCHNTSTRNITFFVSDFNNTIFNHTSMATTPLCAGCHNDGRLHDSTLTKPASDDAYCSTCHGIGGSAATNNKLQHKGLNCTECHANSSSVNSAGKDIHAIKYLTRSNTFTVSNSSAVDCVTCHQTSSVDSSLSGFNAFKIANPIHHSESASNGSIWGSYWGVSTGALNNTYVAQEFITTGTTSGIIGAQSAEGIFETMTEANTGGDGGNESYYATSSSTGHTDAVGAPDNVLSSQNNGRINGSGFASGGSGTITKVVLKYYYSITAYHASDTPTAGYTLNAVDNTTKTETGNVAYNYPDPTYTIDITSAQETWTWSDVQSLSLWLNIAKTGAPGSTANVDAFEIVITTTGGTANHRLEINQNVTGIPTEGNYYLTIRGKTDGDSTESYNVQVYDSGSGWVTKSIISSGTNTWYNTSLTASQISGGKVQIRYVDANVPSDGIQNVLSIDYAGIRSETVSAGFSSCIYCHDNTLHSSTPLGRILRWSPDYVMYADIGTNSSCSDCHYRRDSNYTQMGDTFVSAGLPIPPEITNGTNWKGIFTNYSNHSSPYDDQSCSGCHGSLLGTGANMSEFSHKIKAGIIETGEGINNASCISCHDINSSSSSHWINNSDMNKGVHANLNRNATNSTSVSAENKKCWGCHDANGSQPVNDMGSRYKNPYKCYDCHNATGKPYANVSNAPDVSEHFRGGLEIKAAAGASDNSSSCVVCHNLAEMKVTYTESDIYNSNYSLASHYGRNRTSDALRQGISTNCSYCHQNASTVFIAAMMNISNRSITNHSNYTSSPACTQCHNTGWIHNSTLTRTALTLPNSAFCLSCHGNNGTGGTNYTQAVTGYKEKHDKTVDCTECHLNTSKDIHPVKYLQPDANYSTNNYSTVNCVSCHQDTVYLNLSETPPKIPNPMHHSDNASNGTRWNSTGYWVSNSPLTSCIYCHNDTRHRATALGRPDEWKGDNIVNSSITNQSNWCASCHWQGYVSGEKTYSSVVSAFISAKLPVPPEITNGSYAPRDIPGYYNHSIADYNDSTCKNCHGKSLSANAYMSEFTHNITTPSCTNCHYYYEYMEGVNRTEKFVNQSMFETSTHGSLRCEDCHTKGHKNIGARKACEDCHAVQQDPKNETERHNITSDPWNYSISGVSGSVVNIVDCTICHDAGLYSNATSTYNYTEEKDCDYCHKYPDSTYP